MSDFDFAPLLPVAPPLPSVDAGDLLAAAHAEAASIREQARTEGFDAGQREARAAVTPALAALEQAALQARAQAATAAERLEAEAVELAFAVAEKIIGAHVAVDHELVLESVRGALRGLLEREQVTVLVHPDDLELVLEAGDELRATLGGIERWEVQAERRVARGGAIVRHPDGQIDACLDVKLERAREVVQEHMGFARDA